MNLLLEPERGFPWRVRTFCFPRPLSFWSWRYAYIVISNPTCLFWHSQLCIVNAKLTIPSHPLHRLPSGFLSFFPLTFSLSLYLLPYHRQSYCKLNWRARNRVAPAGFGEILWPESGPVEYAPVIYSPALGRGHCQEVTPNPLCSLPAIVSSNSYNEAEYPMTPHSNDRAHTL